MNDRATALDALQDTTYDLLIIGGGATGAGAALDAAQRGLSVALIDGSDFSSGTSSRSTKLIHGGVRYLEQAFKSFDYGHIALVKEALAERKTLLHIAPHLTRALPLLIPLYKRWQIPYYYAGLKMYDMLAGFKNIGKSHYVSLDKIRRDFPTLRTDDMVGGIVYYDGQFNDARMNVELVRTAQKYGATAFNYLKAESFGKSSAGKLERCNVRNVLSNITYAINARCIINATGVHADTIRLLDDPASLPMVRASAGTHIIVQGNIAPDDLGMLIPQTTDGRVVFVLPWEGATLIGTTDDEAPLSDDPQPTQADIDFLLRETNRYLQKDLTQHDVLSAWTGLRPLVSSEPGASTKSLSRSHVIHTSESGLITITGGKWTTYRNMAQDVIDAAIDAHNFNHATPCKTETTLLVGGEGYSTDIAEKLLKDHNISEDIAVHLAHNYGSLAEEVLHIAADNHAYYERLADGHPFIAAEVCYGVEQEMAQTIIDVISRRMRLSFLDHRATHEAIHKVANIMAELFAWDEATLNQQRSAAYDWLGYDVDNGHGERSSEDARNTA